MKKSGFKEKLIELNNLCEKKKEKHATGGASLCFKYSRNKSIHFTSYCLPYAFYIPLVVTKTIYRVVLFWDLFVAIFASHNLLLIIYPPLYHQKQGIF